MTDHYVTPQEIADVTAFWQCLQPGDRVFCQGWVFEWDGQVARGWEQPLFSPSVITGHTMQWMIVDELARLDTKMAALAKQQNRGPQGHVENWRRRGRKGK